MMCVKPNNDLCWWVESLFLTPLFSMFVCSLIVVVCFVVSFKIAINNIANSIKNPTKKN